MVKIGVPKKIWMYLGYLLLVPSLLVNLYQLNLNQAQKTTYLVTDIIDGDTFATEDKSIIRLFAVDAPALDLCGGQEAKAALEKIILGKRVTIKTQTRVGPRQIALVYLGNNLVDKEILKTGWVDFLGKSVGEGEEKELREIQNNLKAEKIGIFGQECSSQENIDEPKCSIKGNVGRDDDSKIYHFPGCTRYEEIFVEKFRNDQWFCSEKEAQAAGFMKSKNCFEKTFKPGQ